MVTELYPTGSRQEYNITDDDANNTLDYMLRIRIRSLGKEDAVLHKRLLINPLNFNMEGVCGDLRDYEALFFGRKLGRNTFLADNLKTGTKALK